MKISQFVIAAIGLLYSMETGDLAALIIFGILAIIALRRILYDIRMMQ